MTTALCMSNCAAELFIEQNVSRNIKLTRSGQKEHISFLVRIKANKYAPYAMFSLLSISIGCLFAGSNWTPKDSKVANVGFCALK
jgi:hypothetical protein